MGLFDKLKTFVGLHGCSVEMTSLEKQDISNVTFPVTDTVFKGNYKVISKQDCTVLAHIHEIIVEIKKEDGTEEATVISSSRHDEAHEVIGSPIKFPYDLAAGQSVNDGFCITNVDIPAVLQRLGYDTPRAAVNSPAVKFYAKVTADVKGTPMDSECKVQFKVLA